MEHCSIIVHRTLLNCEFISTDIMLSNVSAQILLNGAREIEVHCQAAITESSIGNLKTSDQVLNSHN